MRPQHWVKNAFVAAPLLFSNRFGDLSSWALCLSAVASICLLSSGVYLVNDICDRNRDREHPVKSARPVASGRLSVKAAAVAAAALMLLGLGVAAAIELRVYNPSRPLGGAGLIVWTSSYLALNILYSLWLKNHAVVDVIVVAFGFVLRAMIGAAAIAVPISPWLVLCTFTLCLYVALVKRRSELLSLDAAQAVKTRPANAFYAGGYLEYMLTVSSAVAVVTYSIYCLAPRTVERIGSAHMVWTIPLVFYGMFRYWRLSLKSAGGDPVSDLIRDKVMWAVLIVYAVMSGVIIKYGGISEIRAVLE